MANRAYVFVGAGQLARSHRGGLFRRPVGEGAWELLGNGLPEPLSVQAITVHPTEPGVIYAGAKDGLYRSADRGDRWERLPLPDQVQIWSVHVHPQNRRILYAGGSPVSVYRSDDGGESWRRLPRVHQPDHVRMEAFATRVMRLAVDPSHPREVYAGLEVGGAMRSLDDGESWEDVSADLLKLAELPHLRSRIGSDTEKEGMMDAHAICVSAAAPGTVILAVRMGLFRSRDRGARWEDMQVGRFSPLTYGRDVIVSPHDPRTLFACLSPAARSEDGSLYRSRDLGETWTRFEHGVKARATMMAVTQHQQRADEVHGVSRCGQVFSTLDGGRSWQESQLPEGVHDVYAVATS